MLAGLIRDDVEPVAPSVFRGSAGSRVIGGLFGTQTTSTGRSEVIVLLTPTIVRNPQEAREPHRRIRPTFRAMEPL